MRNMRSALLAAPAYITLPQFYANTLTALVPTIFDAVQAVSRELVGFIPTVARNSTAERVAVGKSINWPVVPTVTPKNTPVGMAIATPDDMAITSDSLTMTKSRTTDFGFTGEEHLLIAGGPGQLSVQGNIIAQCIRPLVNEMEADIFAAARVAGSRGYGTAGTNPFASTIDAAADVRKMLDDNGAPASERALVINTTMGARLRSLGQLTKANEAGTQMTLRDGELLNLMGLSVKESASNDLAITSGTGASATTNTAGYAIGATVITLAAIGTGTIIAGDLITFAGDSNKYLVISGDSDVSNGGTITIGAPGLRKALPASAVAITVVGASTRAIGFQRNAIQLATRVPAKPNQGDARIDELIVTDPRSGIAFEFAVFAGQRMISCNISAVWGVRAHQNDHIVHLIG